MRYAPLATLQGVPGSNLGGSRTKTQDGEPAFTPGETTPLIKLRVDYTFQKLVQVPSSGKNGDYHSKIST